MTDIMRLDKEFKLVIKELKKRYGKKVADYNLFTYDTFELLDRKDKRIGLVSESEMTDILNKVSEFI